jgi:hypothetical protein
VQAMISSLSAPRSVGKDSSVMLWLERRDIY